MLEVLTVNQQVSDLLERAPMLQSNEVRRDIKIVPAKAGVYAWWSDVMPGAAPAVGIERGGRQLLYVGIAPRQPLEAAKVGRGNLRARLQDHCSGPSRRSTFRRSLVALLGHELGITTSRDAHDKILLSDADETRLSNWIGAHCAVSWIETAAPWLIEEEILASALAPPLNIRGSANAFAKTVQNKRSRGFG
ncbi:MAG: GIY-YIG nuclease family protein [Alphaproteobacteria bacterium]